MGHWRYMRPHIAYYKTEGRIHAAPNFCLMKGCL
jgi:hypothetical protein